MFSDRYRCAQLKSLPIKQENFNSYRIFKITAKITFKLFAEKKDDT